MRNVRYPIILGLAVIFAIGIYFASSVKNSGLFLSAAEKLELVHKADSLAKAEADSLAKAEADSLAMAKMDSIRAADSVAANLDLNRLNNERQHCINYANDVLKIIQDNISKDAILDGVGCNEETIKYEIVILVPDPEGEFKYNNELRLKLFKLLNANSGSNSYDDYFYFKTDFGYVYVSFSDL